MHFAFLPQGWSRPGCRTDSTVGAQPAGPRNRWSSSAPRRRGPRSTGRVVPRDEGAGHVSRPRPSPRGPSPDLDTATRSSRPTRSADGGFRCPSVARRQFAGRVVPRDEGAGHVSRPRPSPCGHSPDLDTAALLVTSTRGARSSRCYSVQVLVGYSISGSPFPLVEPASASERRSRPRKDPCIPAPGTVTKPLPSVSGTARFRGWFCRWAVTESNA